IARVDRLRAAHRLGAQIRAPSLAAGARIRGELLAVTVGAFQAAEVTALAAGIAAGNEERHPGRLRCLWRGWRRLLRLRQNDYARGNERYRSQQRYSRVHCSPPLSS